jgi:acyl-CoA reductase-like NAD-dependent aldehyde dehydrogenase
MLYLQNTWTPGKGKNFKSIDPSSGEIIWEGNFATSLQINTALKSSNQKLVCSILFATLKSNSKILQLA